jgi:hypothetical protein
MRRFRPDRTSSRTVTAVAAKGMDCGPAASVATMATAVAPSVAATAVAVLEEAGLDHIAPKNEEETA